MTTEATRQQLTAEIADLRQQLREARERYDVLAALTAGFIYALDVTPEGTIVVRWATDHFEAMTGHRLRTRNAEEELLRLVHPEDQAMVRRHLRSALDNRPNVVAARILTRSGEERWIRSYIQPEWDADEARVTRLIGAAKDITPETRAREALYKHENLFWQTFKAIADPAILWRRTATGEIILEFANPAAVARSNGDIQSFMGMTAEDFFPDAPEVVDSIAAAFETGASGRREMPYRLRTTGERRWVTADYVKVSEEYVLNTIRDITERVEMEQALRESEAKYRALFDEANDAIFLENVDDEILDANRKACELLGYTREELLTMTIPAIQSPEHRGEAGQIIRREWERYGGHPFEAEDLRSDGTRIPVEVSTARIEGLPSERYLSIVRDITERKETQAQLEASLRQKEVLLREVHHRVKNSLAVAAGMLGLQALESGDPEIEAALARSQARLYAMAEVHKHLYRSDDLVEIDMDDYLLGLATHLQASLGRPDVTLDVQVEDVKLDLDTAAPCGLIVNELVSNALEHAFPPGAARGDGRGREIRISLTEEGAALSLKVSDNGVGLPSPAPAASSLGLQLVRLLTGDLEGELHTYTTPDRASGTTVEVTFPRPPV